MGCHTWFYRRCNQEEMNAIKQNSVEWLLKKYNVWENVVNKRYDLIPWDDVDFYLPIDFRSNYDTIEKYTEHVYDMLYTYEYVETIQGIEELVKKHPDYLDLDFNALPEYQQNELNYKVNYYNGFDSFVELQEYIKTYYGKSFDEFSFIERNKYRDELKKLDLSNILEHTEKDRLLELKRIAYLSTGGSGIIKIHNDKFYTDNGCPHDLFRIYNYDAPTFDNPYELIDWVNNYRSERQEEYLTEEETSGILKFFEENDGDVVVDFG